MHRVSTATRRVVAVLLVIAATTLAAWRATPTALPAMRVLKNPGCACCAKWITYMKQEGFTVSVEDKADFTDLKRANGVTRELESCHTAFVGGYVIEGHVPADLVKKLLAEKPAGVKGLSAPGMPASAPGMDMPGQHYTIYSFDAAGHAKVYAQR
ncbi:MAG TPA: DUF411 domain-containing protein [Gemmatimonadales bacterium]|jgi:hypothetical protein